MFFNKFTLLDTHNHWIIASENETLLDNKVRPLSLKCFAIYTKMFSEVCTSSPMYTFLQSFIHFETRGSCQMLEFNPI